MLPWRSIHHVCNFQRRDCIPTPTPPPPHMLKFRANPPGRPKKLQQTSNCSHKIWDGQTQTPQRFQYGWWFRNPPPVEAGSLSHYLQGFMHPRWMFGISSINTISVFGWFWHSLNVDPSSHAVSHHVAMAEWPETTFLRHPSSTIQVLGYRCCSPLET